MKVIVASNDADKIKQIQDFFKDYEVLSLSDAHIDISDVVKGNTFSANAAIMADALAHFTDETVLAFDSGLTIKSLGDFPGVDTYTLLGNNASYKDRNNYILEKMKGIEDRSALFTTCMYIIKDKEHFLITADTEATIALEPKAKNTKSRLIEFDPILVVKDGLTMAEIRKSERTKFSSFYRALAKVRRLNIL